MKHRAVLFDLDGTLLDTLDDLADSMNAALSRLSCPTHEVSAYRYFVGAGMDALARRALPEDRRDAETVARCMTYMEEEYGRRWEDKTRPYDGVPELLAELTARKITTAILSNKPDKFTKKCTARFFPQQQFAEVRGTRPDVPKKPAPDAALELAARLEISPEEFLYLGDSDIDMQTATAAGMYPLGALWGFRTAEELKANGARQLLGKPSALPALL